MASAAMRVVRAGRPSRFASSSRLAGPPASAVKRPSSAAANRCLAAMKPLATRNRGSGSSSTAWGAALSDTAVPPRECSATDCSVTYKTSGRHYAASVPADHGQGQRAWRALVEGHAALFARLADELKAQTGMPITWYDVLLHLAEAKGARMRMRELADAVLLSKSGLTTLVDRMEGAGLVRRSVPPGDRRSIDVGSPT